MSTSRTVVVVVGGNALITDREHVSIEDQAAQAAATCEHIAELVSDGWRTVVTHGNGPQVGFILHCSELGKAATPEVPLVYAVADTQGAIGFMMQQGLANALRRRSLPDDAITFVTRVLVDEDDPAFAWPHVDPPTPVDDLPSARCCASPRGYRLPDVDSALAGWLGSRRE